MVRHLILQTGEFDATSLVEFIRNRAGACTVSAVQTLDQLEAASDNLVDGPARLVSFCSGVIVPDRLLQRFEADAYNIHPGPPNFPGRHPECWGVYYRATRFGATLHRMAALVDEGTIIDTEWFDVVPGTGQRLMAERAFSAALTLLLRWIDRFLQSAAGLLPNGEIWSGRKWRHADLEKICLLPSDISAEEFERRRLAFAELPMCRLVMPIHGHNFVYVVPEDPA